MATRLQITIYVLAALAVAAAIVLIVLYTTGCETKYSAPYGCFLLGEQQSNGNFPIYARKNGAKGSCSSDFTMAYDDWDGGNASDCGQQLLQNDSAGLTDAAGSGTCEYPEMKINDSGNVHIIPSDSTTFAKDMQLNVC